MTIKPYWVSALPLGLESPLAGCVDCGSYSEWMALDQAGAGKPAAAINQNIQ
jgi:hypothetical protein